MKRGALLWGLIAGAFFIAGCGDGGSSQPVPGATSSAGNAGSTTGGHGGAGGAGGMSGTGGHGGAGVGGSTLLAASCSDEPPEGAQLAPPPPAYSGGTCPALAPGKNTITSMGNAREFLLITPADFDPTMSSEHLPVIFLWHWLGGSANDFLERGHVQEAVDTQRFIAVIPESKGDIGPLDVKWPFDTTQSQARMDEEFVFFDDMLSCVAEQYKINNNCVASAGVSAGALFTDQLAGGRGEYLSSILSLSGGVGGVVKPWSKPEHKMPALVLWGGPTDQCFSVMDFDKASKELETALTADGHFFLECIHNCGHAEPPLEAPDGLTNFAGLWQFVFDHPYWLKTGESPYKGSGIPKELPAWCGIGAGSSTPRTGECPNPPGC